MKVKIMRIGVIILTVLCAHAIMTAASTPFNSTDYLLFTTGHSNTFTITDDDLSNCTVELVFQNSTEGNYLITLTQVGEEGGYWRDSAIYVGERDGLLTAWGGAPVGNQANFFRLLHHIPATFGDGETWISKYYYSSYEASYVGDLTINDFSYRDCVLLKFDSTSHSNIYLQGVGEAYLAKDVGIIKFTFNKTDGNHFTARLKEHRDYIQRRISGKFILDSGSPAEGYSVGLSNFVEFGYDAALVDFDGSYSLPFYGSSVIIRYGPISMDGRSLMYQYSQEEKINEVGDIVDYNLAAPDVGLAGPLDERPPELIIRPQNVTIPEGKILFNGHAIGVNGIKNVSVNGELASGLFSGIYYFWQKEINLTEGMNEIQITAYDNSTLQKSTSTNLWINYEKDAYYGPRVEPVPLEVLPQNRQVLTFIVKPNGTRTGAYLWWAPSYREHSPFQRGCSLGHGYDGYDDVTITYDIEGMYGALEVGEEIEYRVHVESSGYWASHEVITITVGSPDDSQPWVESVSPLPGEYTVSTNSSIYVCFNEQLNHLTLIPDNILLNNEPYDGEIDYDFHSYKMTLLPRNPFQPNSKISMELTSGITDYAGNNITAYSWDFYVCESPRIYSISGMVCFASTPLDNILVELIKDGEDTPIFSTNTSQGFYSFSYVTPGLYWAKAYGPTEEYRPYISYRVEVIDQNVTKNIDLPKLLTLLSPENKANVTTSRPTFSWEAFPNASRYSISVHELYNWTLNPIWEDSQSTNHTLQTELSYGKEYAWSIYAYDAKNHLIGSAWPWWSFIVHTLATFDINLYEGWNLIGLPIIPEDTNIEVILSDILYYVESVWAYDGETKEWFSYSPGAPSDLTEMHCGKGYWMKTNADVTWTFEYS